MIDRGPEQDEADARDYRVSFARLQRALPGACSTSLNDGAREIADLVLTGHITDPGKAQYDNHRGLIAAFTAGKVGRLGNPDCARYGAEYEAAWGER